MDYILTSLRKYAVVERSRNIIAENSQEILFFILLLFILLSSNNSISLFDQDEAAYAGFGKYFLENPQAHIPKFLWSEPHRKTPLHFWLITFSYKIFGINEFAVRFPSALAVFFTYLLCFFKAKKYFSTRIALLATAILSTSFFVPLMAKMALTDALLLLWSSICGWTVIDIVESGKQHKGRSLPWQRPTFVLLSTFHYINHCPATNATPQQKQSICKCHFCHKWYKK